ncbi:MAG: bifunctional diaminohydroxyphosphoribosylaminopyrimidine deaminase/5-amino-6-(5-phosphoribosylamino)uracil reductase RibD [Myxococcales bacterium]|nr:bifunctional diaminohydroxyphosphoribosylaminopyrimidine deaminase/5-amino-6-(5-phosphoribosylamino)uracil reductase RibD [Myxococcales bacterium]
MTDAMDGRWMGEALREAKKGDPSPNPHVGAVVVRHGRVVGRGYHRRAGEAHAEVAALHRAGKAAKGATLYVTVEPCNHFGRTPPCTDAIVAAGVARVVIGCADPAPHKKGARAKLRRAGIDVTLGVCRPEAEALIADFAKTMTTGLPWVTAKAAITLDGYVATRTGDSKWITEPAARRVAHRLRADHDAVLVGVGTVLADDPRLDVRLVRGRDPLRVVLDSRLRTPARSRVLTEGGAGTLVFHGPGAPAARRRALIRAGAELQEVRRHKGGLDLHAVLRGLVRRGVVRVLVEGGASVHGAFFDGRLVDRAEFFVAPILLGGGGLSVIGGTGVGRVSDAFCLEKPAVRQVGRDIRISGNVGVRS